MGRFTDRIVHAFDAFLDRGPASEDTWTRPQDLFNGVTTTSHNPARTITRTSTERSIIASIYTRMAIDFASVDMRHVRLDENERWAETIDSGLNNCLNVEANIDQAARHFRQDIASSLFDIGDIVVVPVRTSQSPLFTSGYEIQDMRVGRVVKWRPRHVKVDLYNDRTGKHEEITLPKSAVALIENPLYAVMNEPNSTLKRLIHKLNLLDVVDEQSSSGKLDLIVQLPYVVKTDTKRAQAEQRRKDIEFQLRGSQYGIAYADGTEKITQLNRPAENNLLKQVEYLFTMLYEQLGITKGVMDGTADEATMLNYYSRTIEPMLDAVCEEFARKFLSKTARTQGQSIVYFRDPFKFVPLAQLGEIVNNLSRNEVATANELRPFFGLKPSADSKADQLNNSNINPHAPAPSGPASPQDPTEQEGDS